MNMKPTRYTHCAVPECTSWGKTHPDISFHVFPDHGKQHVKRQIAGTTTYECRRSAWISKLQIQKPVTKNMRVCSRHFVDSDFFDSRNYQGIFDVKLDSRRRLKWSAVPSRNLPGMPEAPTPVTHNNLVFVVVPTELIRPVPVYSESGPVEQLRCSQCSYTSEWNFQMEHHFRREHQTVYDLEFNAVFELELYKCSVCFFSDDCKLSTCRHSDHSCVNNVYVCERCGDYTTFSSLNLLKHRKLCRRVGKQQRPRSRGQTIAEQFKCEQCEYSSPNRMNYHRHMMWHDHRRWHDRSLCEPLQAAQTAWKSCTQCSYRTNDAYSLKRHMLRHADVKDITWHECPICVDVRFKFKSDLAKHNRFKHGPPDQVPCFQCPECPYSSVRKNDLTKHMVTHVERTSRVLTCPHFPCAFRTRRPKILASHVLFHSPQPGQATDQCLHQPGQLVGDRLLVETRQPAPTVPPVAMYKCNQCSFLSNEKKMLMKHVQVHNQPEDQPKWLKCKQPGCSYMCIAELQNSFNRHMLKHLDGENPQ